MAVVLIGPTARGADTDQLTGPRSQCAFLNGEVGKGDTSPGCLAAMVRIFPGSLAAMVREARYVLSDAFSYALNLN